MNAVATIDVRAWSRILSVVLVCLSWSVAPMNLQAQFYFGPVVGISVSSVANIDAFEVSSNSYLYTIGHPFGVHLFSFEGRSDRRFRSLPIGMCFLWDLSDRYSISARSTWSVVKTRSVWFGGLVHNYEYNDHQIHHFNNSIELRMSLFKNLYAGVGACYNIGSRDYPQKRFMHEWGASSSLSFRFGDFALELNYLYPLGFVRHGTADTWYAETWHLRPLSLTASWLLDVRRWRWGGKVNCPRL
jgi:hypothetical protein